MPGTSQAVFCPFESSSLNAGLFVLLGDWVNVVFLYAETVRYALPAINE